MSLGSYESEVGRGNLLNALAHPSVVNPAAAIGNAVQTARGITDLRAAQFNLQQAQLQPAYSSLMALRDNPNASYDDINSAIAMSARGGASPAAVDGLVDEVSARTARGEKPGDIIRAISLRGMPAAVQAQMMTPGMLTRDTGAGLVVGTTGAPGGAQPGVFTPSGFIQSTLTPASATDMVQVGVNPDGSAKMAPRWQISGSGAPGVGPAGAGTATGGSGGPGVSPGQAVNNFGNIRAPGGGFASFPTPQSGIAAMTSLLGSYQDQQGINTLNGITARWAPKGDGANDPVAYANTVSKLTGIDPNAPLNLHDPATLAKIIPAMAQVEHGRPMLAAGDVLNAGISAGLGRNTAAAAPGGGQGGAFIGATSAQPVSGGAPTAQPAGGGGPVRPAGGVQVFSPTGQPVGQGGAGGPPAGGYGGYSGLPLGAGEVAAGNIQRQQALEAQMNKAIDTRATLQGMEAELNNMPTSGVTAGPLATIKNAIVSSGFATQQTVDAQSKGLAAQEQFEKFSALLNGQLLAGMGGQATDARQELTGAATPSSIHSVLGNLGIIHMLEGNVSALQVMGRSFRQAVAQGQASPQQFDTWRDNFTAPQKDGSRFDPRVFWIAQMGAPEQQSYIASLNAKDKAQLLKNANYAEKQGWVFENPDHSMGTGY